MYEHANRRKASGKRLFRGLLMLSVVLGATGPAAAQPGPGRDAGALLGWCEEHLKSGEQPLCGGYFSSILQLRRSSGPVLNGGRPVCAPESVPQNRLIAIFVAWMQKHPEAKPDNMGDAMSAAIGEEYPCGR
jgi:hypothetical protein